MAKAITTNKPAELQKLEQEIAMMRDKGNLTPEQETEIIKKELEVLKRYCDKLSNIQEENDKLKLDNQQLKQYLKNIPGTGTILAKIFLLIKPFLAKVLFNNTLYKFIQSLRVVNKVIV